MLLVFSHILERREFLLYAYPPSEIGRKSYILSSLGQLQGRLGFVDHLFRLLLLVRFFSYHFPCSFRKNASPFSPFFLLSYIIAKDYDAIIAVATGIGITPALAVIDRLKNARRVNLIWMARDASLVEFVTGIWDFPEDSFLFIFYTGKAPLTLSQNFPNLFVFNGRPELETVIVNIIHRIEAGVMLPEQIVEEGTRYQAMETTDKVQALVSKLLNDYDPDEFFDAAAAPLHAQQMGSTRSLLSNSRKSFNNMFKNVQVHRRGSVNVDMRRRSLLSSIPPQGRRGSRFSSINSRMGSSFSNRLRRNSNSTARNSVVDFPQDVPQKLECVTHYMGTSNLTVEEKEEESLNGHDSNMFMSDTDVESKTATSDFDRIGMTKKTESRTSTMDFERTGITKRNFANTVSDFTGNLHTSSEEINELFDRIDADKNGTLSRQEVMDFMETYKTEGDDHIENDLEDGKLEGGNDTNEEVDKPWVCMREDKKKFVSSKQDKKEVLKGSDNFFTTQKNFVKANSEVVKTWEILYCGGNSHVVKSLKNISTEYGIDLNIEKFDW